MEQSTRVRHPQLIRAQRACAALRLDISHAPQLVGVPIDIQPGSEGAERKNVRRHGMIAQLDAKLAAKTITSNDLPGTIQSVFPSEFKGMTLAELGG